MSIHVYGLGIRVKGVVSQKKDISLGTLQATVILGTGLWESLPRILQ